MKKRGFTLVEMLTVIVVISLLMGVMLKLFPIITRASDKAITIKKLQATANAINEYYATYGAYPPVQSVKFQLEDYVATMLHEEGGTRTEGVFVKASEAGDGEVEEAKRKYGLLAYLTPCPKEGKEYFTSKDKWFEDSDSDKAAKKRWAHFLDGVVSGGSEPIRPIIGGDPKPYTYVVSTWTVKDGWGHELKYESYPPYTSYKLWSTGPTPLPDDDIYVGSID